MRALHEVRRPQQRLGLLVVEPCIPLFLPLHHLPSLIPVPHPIMPRRQRGSRVETPHHPSPLVLPQQERQPPRRCVLALDNREPVPSRRQLRNKKIHLQGGLVQTAEKLRVRSTPIRSTFQLRPIQK